MGGHSCSEKEFSCGVCKNMLIKAKCCRHKWRVRPLNIKMLGDLAHCSDCFYGLKCGVCGISFKEVFNEEGSSLYQYFGTSCDYRSFFHYDKCNDFVTEKDENGNTVRRKTHEDKLTCRPCLQKKLYQDFLNSRTMYKIFQNNEPLDDKQILPVSYEKNKENVLLSLPYELLNTIFSFLIFPKYFSRLCLISKHVQLQLYFQNDFFWIKSLRVRSRKVISRNAKYLVHPDHFIYEMLRRFSRFPGFTGFEGLETFDFEGVSDTCQMVFLEYLKNNNGNLRQTIECGIRYGEFIPELYGTYLQYLLVNKLIDFENLKKCTIIEDYIPILFDNNKFPNLKKLVLHDSRQKREMLYENDRLFHPEPLPNDTKPTTGAFETPDRVTDEKYRSLTHKVDWSRFKNYRLRTLNLDLSPFPSLECLILRDSRVRVFNICPKLRDLRIVNSLVLFPASNDDIMKLRKFVFLDSLLVDPNSNNCFDHEFMTIPFSNNMETNDLRTLNSFLAEKCGSHLEYIRTNILIDFGGLAKYCNKLRHVWIDSRYISFGDFEYIITLPKLEKINVYVSEHGEQNFMKEEEEETTTSIMGRKIRKCEINYVGDTFHQIFRFLSTLDHLEHLSLIHTRKSSSGDTSQTGMGTIFNHFTFLNLITDHLSPSLKVLSIAKTKDYSEIPITFTRGLATSKQSVSLRVLKIHHTVKNHKRPEDSALNLGHLKHILRISTLEELHSSFSFTEKDFEVQGVREERVKEWFECKNNNNLHFFSMDDPGEIMLPFFIISCRGLKKIVVKGDESKGYSSIDVYIRQTDGSVKKLNDIVTNNNVL